MNIVLVWPPHRFSAPKAYSMPPLGLLYLAASLKKNNYKPEVLDLSLHGLSLDACAKMILKSSPGIVGFSVMTDRLHVSLLLAKC